MSHYTIDLDGVEYDIEADWRGLHDGELPPLERVSVGGRDVDLDADPKLADTLSELVYDAEVRAQADERDIRIWEERLS